MRKALVLLFLYCYYGIIVGIIVADKECCKCSILEALIILISIEFFSFLCAIVLFSLYSKSIADENMTLHHYLYNQFFHSNSN